MKLSKLTLEWLIYHAQHSDVAGYTELKIIEEINDALSDDTLEIEGYEKSEWTKFDLDDPKTFPPNDTMVLYNCKGEVYYGDFTDVSKSSLFEVGTTFWRPRPNPPTETEVQK